MDVPVNQFTARHRPRKTFEQRIEERLKRIETRITTLSLALGVEVPCRQPVFEPGAHGSMAASRLTLLSINSSVRDLLSVIPADHSGMVDVRVGDNWVMTLSRVDGTAPVP